MKCFPLKQIDSKAVQDPVLEKESEQSLNSQEVPPGLPQADPGSTLFEVKINSEDFPKEMDIECQPPEDFTQVCRVALRKISSDC